MLEIVGFKNKNVLKEFELFKKNNILEKSIDVNKNMVFILNNNNDTVFFNKAAEDYLENKNIKKIIGSSICENLSCAYYGCENIIKENFCSKCSLLKMIDNVELKKENTEFSIIRDINEKYNQLEFSANISSFNFIKNNYKILCIEDMKNKKYKDELDKIFYHDLMNTITSFNSMLGLLVEGEYKNKKFLEEVLPLLYSDSYDMIDQIKYQREMKLAELNELKLRLEEINPKKYFIEIINKYKKTKEYADYNFEMEFSKEEKIIISDKVLLSRVLLNLIKNAVEASKDSKKIIIGYYYLKDKIIFFIKNSEYIPLKIQEELFKSPVLTKKYKRGLGSYSAKLLTEVYLNGEIWFESKKENGTIFYVRIPIKEYLRNI